MKASIGQDTALSMTCRSVWGDGGGEDTISGECVCPFHTTFKVIQSLASHL